MHPGSPGVIAVTGATGFVGRHAIAELVRRGFTVRALVRDREKAQATLPEEGVHRVIGGVFDPGAVEELVEGADGVVHSIGIRREAGPGVTFERMHVEATRRVLGAARAAGVDRWVQVSALGVRPDAPTAYQKTKYEAERLVRACGMDWVILRPSIIHGADGEFVQMIKGWATGRSAPHLFIPYFTRVEVTPGFPPKPPKFVSAMVAPVGVDDVASAIATALETDEAVGEVVPLVGPDEMDWPTMMATIRDALPIADHSKRIVGIPGPLALGAALKAKFFGMAGLLPFGTSEPVMATEDSTASVERARALLGVDPGPFAPAVRAYAAEA